MDAADKLRQMINDADEQVDNLDDSIDQIQSQITELASQDSAIVNGELDIVAYELNDYLDGTKVEEFKLIDSGATLVIGATYNVIGYSNQLTDWRIIDSTSGDTLYQYNGTGWDGDTLILQYLDEWDFGNDYLTRPLTSGASYGIRPYIVNLNVAKSILQENRDKVYESITVFERFAS